MKKSLFLVAPIIFILSACDSAKSISIGFSENDSHSRGFDYETSSTSQRGKVDSYSYRNNDTLDNSALTKAEMTFVNITSSQTDIQSVETINSYVSVSQDIYVSASNPLYFNTKAEGLAFLGADSNLIDGEITFAFSQDIKNIEIEAVPYNYIKNSFNQDTLIIDEDVAISVNDNGYIKLGQEINKSENKVISSAVAFHLASPSNTITLKVGRRRAILEKITLYY